MRLSAYHSATHTYMTGTRRPLASLLIFLTFCILPAAHALAGGWNAAIGELPHLPPRFVAVDKSRQTLFLYRHSSPLEVSATYTCTTGQATGDKQVEGDLRTPEGVYFVEHRIDKGLDWDLYGGIAYTLNYPNPVDALRRKTGFGIWIHGRGHEITPRETQGCIALNMADIEVLGPGLERGLPVIVAQGVNATGAQPEAERDAATARLLAQRSQQWAAAWQARSDDFFDFYAPEQYTLSGSGRFNAFRQQKERLFRHLDWIQTIVRDVQALEGPGYWVTWFRQYYRAPNLTTEGIRRLYWLQDPQGAWRVAGMEWRPGAVGMKQEYMDFVRGEGENFVSRWRTAWLNADMEKYMECYARDAVQGGRSGIADIRSQKAALWSQKKPRRVILDDINVSLHHDGLKLTMTQRYADSSGYSDEGVKTLVLRPEGESWRIVREDWRQD